MKNFKRSHFFSEVFHALECSMESGIEPRADILWVGSLNEPEQQLLVEVPCAVNLLLGYAS